MAAKRRKSAAGKARDGEPTKKAAPRRRKPSTRARRKAQTSGSVADRANRAAKRAKANGAIGRHLGAAKQMLRDTAIVSRAAQGIPQRAIGAEFGIAERTVQLVLSEQRKLRSPLEKSPMELLEDLARLYELDAANLAAISHTFVDTDPAVAVRSIRAGIDARRALAELMSAVGKLPTDLELFRTENEMRRLGERMREAVEKMMSGEIPLEQAWEVFDEIAREPRQVIDSTAEELPPGD